jgi:hypothetical protein
VYRVLCERGLRGINDEIIQVFRYCVPIVKNRIFASNKNQNTMKTIEKIKNDIANKKPFRYEENGVIITGELDEYDDYIFSGDYDKYGIAIVFDTMMLDMDETIKELEWFFTNPLDYSYHRYKYFLTMSFEEYLDYLNGEEDEL